MLFVYASWRIVRFFAGEERRWKTNEILNFFSSSSLSFTSLSFMRRRHVAQKKNVKREKFNRKTHTTYSLAHIHTDTHNDFLFFFISAFIWGDRHTKKKEKRIEQTNERHEVWRRSNEKEYERMWTNERKLKNERNKERREVQKKKICRCRWRWKKRNEEEEEAEPR